MKYFLIAGEASGDLHAADVMRALQRKDPDAEFRFIGGDLMCAVGGQLLYHYRCLAYMGIIAVALHLPAILKGLRRCKKEIKDWRPDCVILIDYPGFNMKMAKYVHRQNICPVYYYIAPKIWAWKEYRITLIVCFRFYLLRSNFLSRSIIAQSAMWAIRLLKRWPASNHPIKQLLQTFPSSTG